MIDQVFSLLDAIKESGRFVISAGQAEFPVTAADIQDFGALFAGQELDGLVYDLQRRPMHFIEQLDGLRVQLAKALFAFEDLVQVSRRGRECHTE